MKEKTEDNLNEKSGNSDIKVEDSTSKPAVDSSAKDSKEKSSDSDIKVEDSTSKPVVDSSAKDSKEKSSDSDIKVEDTTSEVNDIAVVKESKENVDVPDKKELNYKFPFIIGKKIGMTQIYSDTGTVFPATIVHAGPCFITQIKTNNNDGYKSIQLSYLDKKESKTNKSLLNHFKKANVSPKKYLKEFRFDISEDIKLGNIVNIKQYNVGDLLTVTGYSKGKGFAGHMKRHNFSGGRASHGKNSVLRKAGSIGAGTDPGKVWLGTRMAGRMGNDKVTIKNLKVVRLEKDKDLIFLKGSIPGSNNCIVYLNKSN